MKKQILSVTMSIAILSTTPILASSSSDNNDSNPSRFSNKTKSRSPTVKKRSSKKKRSSHHHSKQDSEDSDDNRVRHNKSKTKGQRTGQSTSSIFSARSSIEESVSYSIPTTDSPTNITTTPSGEEILAPCPTLVQKNTKKRVPKHAAAFEKQTGYRSATTYIEEESIEIDAPQIGHAQGYQNHGSVADTRKDNLAVISQTTNLKMNVVDRKYKNGDMDANRFIVQKDTRIATYSLQQLANPSNSSLALTPSIVMSANLEPLSKEENAEFKKKATRALDPERKKAIKQDQKKKPEDFPTIEENTKKVQRKIKEYEAEGKSGPHVIKFSDQSRSNRNKKVQSKKQKDKKSKK